MADTKISNMTDATSLSDADIMPVVQGGSNKKAALSVLTSYIFGQRFIDADFFVNTYADLPSAATNSGKLAYVKTTTGTILLLSRKTRGFYRSDGASWLAEDAPYRTADSVWFDPTGLAVIGGSVDDVQEAINALDAAVNGKQASDSDLTALANNSSNGLWARTSAGNGSARTITAGTGIAVTNGDGVSGNPTVAGSSNALIRGLICDIDGSGSTPSTGSKAKITAPCSFTVTNWYVVADQTGSCVVDVKRSGSSIVGGGGNKPTLSSAASANAAVSGWTSTAISAGDIIEFNLDSVTSCQHINVVIKGNLT